MAGAATCRNKGTGIFHVMMRGINHQNIFEDDEDNWQFLNTLDRMRMRMDGNDLSLWHRE